MYSNKMKLEKCVIRITHDVKYRSLHVIEQLQVETSNLISIKIYNILCKCMFFRLAITLCDMGM